METPKSPKQRILDVLDELQQGQNGQLNLASEAARETIADRILACIEKK